MLLGVQEHIVRFFFFVFFCHWGVHNDLDHALTVVMVCTPLFTCEVFFPIKQHYELW